MQTKLFVGTRLTPELKMHLSGSYAPFQCIPYEGKEYLGTYIEAPHPTVTDLQAACTAFQEQLQPRLLDIRSDTLPLVVFPQLFVG